MKWLVIFLISIFAFSFFVPVVSAQTAYPPTSAINLTSNLAPGTTLDVNTSVQVITLNLFASLECALGGTNSLRVDHKCLSIDSSTGQLSYTTNKSNLLSGLVLLISKTTIPPVHTSDYIEYAKANFGIPHAYAANAMSGVDTIQPLLQIWAAFRNIVYILYVLALIIVGFAIMLRIKIDPRTVMTVQNQLPNIIVNLILVTFSFAIAGLLIDLMWLLTYVVIGVIASIPIHGGVLTGNPQLPTGQLINSPIQFVNSVMKIGDLAGQAGDALTQVITSLAFSFGNGDCLYWLGVNWGACLSGILGNILGLLGKIIVYIAILVALIRLWWTLIQSYMFILINIVIGPFTIFSGVIPGVKSGFGAWLKTMISNLIVFPAALTFLLLGQTILDALKNAPGTLFIPPLLINATGTGATNGTANTNAFSVLIGIVIILLVPKVTNMVKDLLKETDFKYASSVFEAVGAGTSVGGAVQKGTGSYLFSEKNSATGRMGGLVTQRLFENPTIAKLFRRERYGNGS